MTVRLLLASAAFSTLLAGCGYNLTRSGPLAGLADSLLPDRVLQTCVIVPAEALTEPQGATQRGIFCRGRDASNSTGTGDPSSFHSSG